MKWHFLYRTFLLCLKGVPTTLLITILTLVFSSIPAIGIAVIRSKRVPVLQKICSVYVSFIRGTPAIVQIYLLYNTLASILTVWFEKNNVSINVFDISPIVFAVIVFTLNITATMSEVVRSALLTVDKGQMEAAVSIGLSELQGFLRVVFPQALVSAIPNLCTLIVNLIKMTSLACAMTVKDITAIAKIEAGSSYNYIEAYLDIFVIYLILCIVIEKMFQKLERNLSRYKAIAD